MKHKLPPSLPAIDPNDLYHYTGWAGLHGILDSKCLWATHSSCLNDYMEGKVFQKYIEKTLYPFVEEEFRKFVATHKNPDNPITDQELSTLIKEESPDLFDRILRPAYDILHDGYYITSFCTHKDPYHQQNGLLSLWRAYGKEGGFAIVFDQEKLQEMIDAESKQYSAVIGLPKVVYEGDWESEKNEGPHEIISSFKKVLPDLIKARMFPEETRKENNNWGTPTISFIMASHQVKDRGFKEENETRIVVNYLKNPPAGIAFKERHYLENSLTPYVKLFEGTALPIKRIIVGPQPLQARRASILKVKLSNQNIEVICSETPFIDK